MRGNIRAGSRRNVVFVVSCLAALLGGCNESKTQASAIQAKADDGAFDTSRLPRVSGAKEIFASAAVTNFTSPDPVAQTADTLDQALASAGWQKYEPPFTSRSEDPNMRQMTLKKGTQALNVFIAIAPAQNNATSVQYSGLPLKTDLPFTKDASNVEYSPERPLLTLLTAQPINETLDFYRKELGDRGWSLWSEKLDAKQPAGGPSGNIREHGASADYVSDKEPSMTLVLTMQQAEAGQFKVELKEWPIEILASMHKAYLNGGNTVAEPVDVSALPRLEGANVETASPAKVSYTVPGSVERAIDATKKMLLAEGWQPYAEPLEEPYALSLKLKKGAQGLSVLFTMPAGQPVHAGVDYSPTRLPFALPFPPNATDIVFDQNRPYLNCVMAGTIEAAGDFFSKALTASGWVQLTEADASKRWPGAKLTADGTHSYYISENQRPVVLSLQASGDGKVSAEIRVPPFAEAQTLEADTDVFGMPRPKLVKSSGGTGGDTVRESHAHVLAEVDTVLAFYRRELAARNWTEQAQGAVLNPDDVKLTFSSATEGTATLKLSHKYDVTIVSLVQQLPKAPAKPQTAAKSDSVDDLMKQAQQMMRDNGIDPAAFAKTPKGARTAEPSETLHERAGNDVPLPVPDTAEDVDLADQRLEFNTESSVTSVANFYRTTLAQQGWKAQPTVVNQPTMVALDFSKGRQAMSFTIMKLGAKTNVTATGSALKVADASHATKPSPRADAPSMQASATDVAVQATADDLMAEESGGLPVPKRHTLSDGTKTPFRRDLKASVPLELSDVLDFYRRELGKLGWTEQSSGTAVAAGSAVIAYASTEGPALLTLGRKDDETTVSLVVRNADAATKAGVIPKPGQVKLLVSNANSVAASITIDKKTATVAPGGGMKGPDGAIIDLAPGKYKYSVKLNGQPAHSDDLEVSADQTWGLVIGPGGALPLQVY